MTLRSGELYKRFGDPHRENNLALWVCPTDLLAKNPKLPKRIYANKDIHAMLTQALRRCDDKGVLNEINSFGGCFNIRNIRGSGEQSLHSYAYAVDFNVKDNPLGKSRARCVADGLKPFTERFVSCWEESGWEWGGRWSRPDGQHFQPARLQ